MTKNHSSYNSGQTHSLIENLDQVNRAYFNILYHKFNHPNKNPPIKIAQEKKSASKNNQAIPLAYPTAIASKELMKNINVYHYHQLEETYAKESKNISLWIKKMHAGTGSTVERKTFLSEIRGKEKEEIRIGAKGTDLYATLNIDGKKRYLSLAELQILQIYYRSQKNHKKIQIIIQDIVGPETVFSLEELWKAPSLVAPQLSYAELFEKEPLLSRHGQTFQAHIPTISSRKCLTTERIAPGGHALFAVDALIAAYKDEMRPKTDPSQILISALANGEDLSACPDDKMLGLMKEKNIPIAMVTTTKTKNDLKGGQIAIIKMATEYPYIAIIEKAQADQLNQTQLFEELGLRPHDEIAFFNTNMALINYDVLSPLLKDLISSIGEDKFFQIIAPDLILNKKIQTDNNGIENSFFQMEGAMGSVFLNLDRYWREHFHSPLVSFINVDTPYRTNFFAPIKTAFDFYMQFYSDRFTLNSENMVLINNRPESLPSVSFQDKLYDDAKNVLTHFNDTKILQLDLLNITNGKFDLSGTILKGEIRLQNYTDKTFHPKEYFLYHKSQKEFVGISIQDNRVILENCHIIIETNNNVLVKEI